MAEFTIRTGFLVIGSLGDGIGNAESVFNLRNLIIFLGGITLGISLAAHSVRPRSGKNEDGPAVNNALPASPAEDALIYLPQSFPDLAALREEAAGSWRRACEIIASTLEPDPTIFRNLTFGQTGLTYEFRPSWNSTWHTYFIDKHLQQGVQPITRSTISSVKISDIDDRWEYCGATQPGRPEICDRNTDLVDEYKSSDRESIYYSGASGGHTAQFFPHPFCGPAPLFIDSSTYTPIDYI